MSLEDMKEVGKSVADVKAARYTKEEAEAAGFDTTSETSGWATAPTSTVPTDFATCCMKDKIKIVDSLEGKLERIITEAQEERAKR